MHEKPLGNPVLQDCRGAKQMYAQAVRMASSSFKQPGCLDAHLYTLPCVTSQKQAQS